MAAYSTAECIKIHKRLAKCKKNIEHEKKYEKSKTRKNYLRSNSPDDDIEFKLKKHKAGEAKTETHKSKRRDRSRSINRARSPKRDKKPRWSHSRSSRDRLSRNSPDDNIQFKPKKYRTEEAITETHKSKKRYRSRSINRDSSPKCDKRPRWSHSRSSRDSEKIDKKKPFKINRNNFLPLVPRGVLSAGDAKRDSTAKITTKTLDELTVPKKDEVPVIGPVSSPKNTVVLEDYQDAYPSAMEPSAFTNTYVHGINSETETEKFTGHIGTKLPSPALSNEYQPLINKDQLKNAASVNSGIGMINGEGLGQNQSGPLEPVSLDVKTDKRGLVAEKKLPGKRTKRFSKKVAKPKNLSIEGKNRIRLLYEFCAKRKWERPMFDIIDESGPAHRKTFIIVVNVNGVKYSSSRCLTKKLAKLEAANACLKELLD